MRDLFVYYLNSLRSCWPTSKGLLVKIVVLSFLLALTLMTVGIIAARNRSTRPAVTGVVTAASTVLAAAWTLFAVAFVLA